MKSPAELAARLRRQWLNGTMRETRFTDAQAWPVVLPVGVPSAREFVEQAIEVRAHVAAWRAVTVGLVHMKSMKYREAGDRVDMPHRWEIRTPAEWAQACLDQAIAAEHAHLAAILERADSWARPMLVRHSASLPEISVDQALQIVGVARRLAPGCAAGKPLRALSVSGTDTKFFERHRALVTALLDVRFDDQPGEVGLEEFLGAQRESEHWLLVSQLYAGPLPFPLLRVPATSLLSGPLPGSHLLLVENERSLHQIPILADTVAVLGSGRDLAWLRAPWICDRRVGYWGDIDTWGLAMLADARKHRPSVTPLLMTQDIYDVTIDRAVAEPLIFGPQPPSGLTEAERLLYQFLVASPRGRLEQELIHETLVHEDLNQWRYD